jgi:uncharacterized protein (DUF1501 family)
VTETEASGPWMSRSSDISRAQNDVHDPWLHPECPDHESDRWGPNRAEALLRARAARVTADRERREDLWRRGFTRRRLLAGAGMAGVAPLGSQLVTTRVSLAAPLAPASPDGRAQEGSGTGTLVVVFLRGGMDGLAALVPGDDPHLTSARPDLAVPSSTLLPLTRGFGLHPQLAPLHAHWRTGKFTAVPAVSTPDISRSHFQAQDCLERGGSSAGTIEGWLDRVLDRLGPGTTFRAVAQGSALPRSLAGDQSALSITKLDSFELAGWDEIHDKTVTALTALYTGFEHPLAGEVAAAIGAFEVTERLLSGEYAPSVTYPEGELGEGLTELARLIKGDAGVRVATIDVGGWDMHTNLGTVDNGDMQRNLGDLAAALAAFATDLGPKLDQTTIVTLTEFGRRIEQNASRGTDHGHGAAVLLLGGGLAAGTIPGKWEGLAPEVRDQGDVPGSNDYRDVLGDVLTKRLGLGADDLAAVFPEHSYQPIGVMA